MKQIPLKPKSKLPAHNNWRRREYTNEEIEAHRAAGGNVGLRLEAEDLIIDVDTKHADAAGRDAAELELALEQEFGIDLSGYPRVETGSGGSHIYIQKPAELRIREKLKDKFGGAIEFKTVGRQVLAPGCIHPNGNPYVINRRGKISMGPQALLDAIERPAPQPSSGPTDADAAHLKALLDQLDPANFQDYDDWRNMMFACHDAGGGAEDARDVFVEWSTRDPEFPDTASDIAHFWEACEVLGDDEDRRTLRSIEWAVRAVGGDIPTGDPLEDFADLLAAATVAEVTAATHQPRWRVNREGRIMACEIHNVVEAMRVFDYDFAMNMFSHRIIDRSSGRELHDGDLERLSQMISDGYGTRWTGNPSKEKLQSAAVWMANTNRFHPIHDYLEGLKWDGEARMQSWLIEGAGAKDCPYTRAISELLLVAAVARVYRPGVKFDTMVIFEGTQGTGKSTLVRHLGGEWTLEGLPPLRGANDKDVVDAMQGYWLVEIEELSATRKADADTLKAFLSKTEDRVRLAYARNSTTFPRQCVLIGTTNEDTYLRDMTGNRRMAPLKLGHINLKSIPRDQLWAEAFQKWQSNRSAPMHLPAQLWSAAAQEQEGRRVRDPWEDMLTELCFEKYVGQGFIPSTVLLREGAHIAIGDQTMAHMKRMSNAMQRLGIPKARQRHNVPEGTSPRNVNPINGYMMPKEQG